MRLDGNEETAPRGAPLWPWVVLVLVIFVLAGIMVCRNARTPVDTRGREELSDQGTLTQSVMLYYADHKGTGLTGERRELVLADSDREEIVRRLLLELARGPASEGAYPVLPSSTLAQGVYFDDLGGLYIDFHGVSLASWTWGSRSEILAIRSIIRTVSESFPELLHVGFLVDGERVETLGGHVELLHSYEVAEWR